MNTNSSTIALVEIKTLTLNFKSLFIISGLLVNLVKELTTNSTPCCSAYAGIYNVAFCIPSIFLHQYTSYHVHLYTRYNMVCKSYILALNILFDYL